MKPKGGWFARGAAELPRNGRTERRSWVDLSRPFIVGRTAGIGAKA